MKENETESYKALKKEVTIGDKKRTLYVFNPPVNKSSSVKPVRIQKSPSDKCGGCSRKKAQ